MDQFYEILKFKTNTDNRGKLTAIEFGKDVNFDLKRMFYMHHITDDRGGHAHKDTNQIIIAIHGNFNITIDNGKKIEKILLNDPETGLFLPRLTFTFFSDISTDAVCLVLADTHYDYSKSIRSYSEFISIVNNSL